MATVAAALVQDEHMMVDVHNISDEFNNWNHSYAILNNPEMQSFTSCTNVTGFSDYFNFCSREFQIISSIKLFSLPIFVVIGSIGNMLCFAVLTQKGIMQNSMSFYMAVLMIVHTMVLYMGCGLEWFAFVTEELSVLHTMDWLCRFFHFSFNVIRCAGWWILVAMTVDCYLDMWCPVKAQYMCTIFIAKFVTTTVFVWLLSLHVHAMWIYEVNHGICMLDTDRQDFETIVWPWITAIFSHYVPMLLVLIFLILLIIGSSSNRSQELSINQKRHSNLTIILAVFFICTALPTIIMNFVDQSQPKWQISQDKKHWSKHAEYILWQVIFTTLESFYISSSFLLFFAMIPSLRSELSSLLSKICSTRSRRRGRAQELRNTGNSDRLIETNESKSDDHHHHTSFV